MASLFVERRGIHHHLLALLVLVAMVMLLALLHTHHP
jgi:hypothetical protein